jgi:dTDP-4-dehydrorhamnose reductase
MRALVVGGTGMLGSDVVAELERRGHEVFAPPREELDLTRPDLMAHIPGETWGRFDWCFNCAAYTAVDKAEEDRDEAIRLNLLGPGYLASACSLGGVKLLHVSTDFVFDGDKSEPYEEDDPTHPLGVYGETKREGEREALAGNMNTLVVRTSWLYGPNGKSFPRTMIQAWLAGKNLRVVADQRGSPTYTGDLARTLLDLAEANPMPGIYHASGPEESTWYELAVKAITTYRSVHLRAEDLPEIEPIATEDWPTPTKRPMYSVLSNNKLTSLGIRPMRGLDEALEEFCRRLRLD